MRTLGPFLVRMTAGGMPPGPSSAATFDTSIVGDNAGRKPVKLMSCNLIFND